MVAALRRHDRAAGSRVGQEVFNAAVLFAAVAMLGWHNIWMTRHGREMTVAANRLGAAVRAGTQPLWALGFAVGLAVLREGSEVVLFLYGIAAAGDGGVGGDGVRRRARALRPGLRPGRRSISGWSASRCGTCSR